MKYMSYFVKLSLIASFNTIARLLIKVLTQTKTFQQVLFNFYLHRYLELFM